jgi:hypothetical protein
LILLTLTICTFSARFSQALDFSGFPGYGEARYQQSYPQEMTLFTKALWNQRLTRDFAGMA